MKINTFFSDEQQLDQATTLNPELQAQVYRRWWSNQLSLQNFQILEKGQVAPNLCVFVLLLSTAFIEIHVRYPNCSPSAWPALFVPLVLLLNAFVKQPHSTTKTPYVLLLNISSFSSLTLLHRNPSLGGTFPFLQ